MTKETLTKIFGVILIVDGGWSLISKDLPHTTLFDLGRLVRLGIGVWMTLNHPKIASFRGVQAFFPKVKVERYPISQN